MLCALCAALANCTCTIPPFASALTFDYCRVGYTCTLGQGSARGLLVSTTALPQYRLVICRSGCDPCNHTRLRMCSVSITTGWRQRRASNDSFQRSAPRTARQRTRPEEHVVGVACYAVRSLLHEDQCEMAASPHRDVERPYHSQGLGCH